MKILILGFTKLQYMPYMNFYLDKIDYYTHEVHILYWNRDSYPDCERTKFINYHPYEKYMDDALPIVKKAIPIFGYGRFARKIINEINPDFLIVLHSTTAYTIKNLLTGKYKNKYIFDYRDLTYEKYGLYKEAVKKIVDNSCLTFTSSDGFRFVLPENDKVITSHNILNNAWDIHMSMQKKKKKSIDEKLCVAFWGLLRGYDINKKIITTLCEDGRFLVDYYGRAQGKMEELMIDMSEKYEAFHFHGIYNREDTLEFAKKTDLLLDIYKSGGTEQYAMTNKYYDGIVYRIPQLVAEKTYMSDRCESSGVGMACNPYDESFAERVVEYYRALDFDTFEKNCTAELKLVLNQVQIGKRRIEEFFL